MANWKKLAQGAAGAAGGEDLDINDVFSTYVYEGNGSTKTITNGIDLSTEGGMVWIKNRQTTYSHQLFDTERGATKYLISNLTNAENTATNSLTSFNTDGFSLSDQASVNTAVSSVNNFASWTFRKAPKFFDVVTYTGNGTAGRTISHNLGSAPGMIIVKCTSNQTNWMVYHRGADATAPEDKYLRLNEQNGVSDSNIAWNDTAPTATEFTLGGHILVNGSGEQYVAYLFAHNDGDGEFGPDADQDIIKCGSFTNSSGLFDVDLGFEPQWLLMKRADNTGNWHILDNMRGITDQGVVRLYPNDAAAESTFSGNYVRLTPTGFKGETNYFGTSAQVIYIAIRRGPMAAPTAATEVFDVVTRTGNSTNTTVTMNQSFTSDWIITKERGSGGGNTWLADRLRGIMNASQGVMFWNSKAAETTAFSSGLRNAYEGEYEVGTTSGMNNSGDTFVDWHWKRAPQFFDIVAYSGNGVSSPTHEISHNLGVTPEILMFKCRNKGTEDWYLRFGSQTIFPGGNVAAISSTFNITMTDSYFTAPGNGTFNNATSDYIAYLFATLAGISKVGTYTGNGTSQTIDCGFSSGARFVLIKRTDSTGDWYVWDTARGIVAANDPHLSLHTTSPEVTTDDSIDPVSSGFAVNQVSATNINVSSATYLFYAIA